jgi:hypothetical protein
MTAPTQQQTAPQTALQADGDATPVESDGMVYFTELEDQRPTTAAPVLPEHVAASGQLALDYSVVPLRDLSVDEAKQDQRVAWIRQALLLEQTYATEDIAVTAELNSNPKWSAKGRHEERTERVGFKTVKRADEIRDRLARIIAQEQATLEARTADVKRPLMGDGERIEAVETAKAIGAEAMRLHPTDAGARTDWLIRQMRDDPAVAHVFANTAHWLWRGSRPIQHLVQQRARPELSREVTAEAGNPSIQPARPTP